MGKGEKATQSAKRTGLRGQETEKEAAAQEEEDCCWVQASDN